MKLKIKYLQILTKIQNKIKQFNVKKKKKFTEKKVSQLKEMKMT